jgi:hypothetical protein
MVMLKEELVRIPREDLDGESRPVVKLPVGQSLGDFVLEAGLGCRKHGVRTGVEDLWIGGTKDRAVLAEREAGQCPEEGE